MKILYCLLVLAVAAILIMSLPEIEHNVLDIEFNVHADGTVFVIRNYDLICTL